MAVRMKGRHLLSMSDLSAEEVEQVFEMSRTLKAQQYAGAAHRLLEGKALGMIFEKPSTRTRVSFEVGIGQLGGFGIFMSPKDLQIGRGETLPDTARTLSRYCDGLMARVFKHDTVAQLAAHSRVPVINGLSDLEHPCQALADFFTVREKKGRLAGLTMAWVGDGNNVAHSLALGAAMLGMRMTLAVPAGFDPSEPVMRQAGDLARRHGGSVQVVREPAKAVAGADVIYTDVWTSMGQEEETQRREKAFGKFQVNQALVERAQADAIVMHCLPAHRGSEITDDVVDGPHSVVWDEAENRLHVQKAVMALLM